MPGNTRTNCQTAATRKPMNPLSGIDLQLGEYFTSDVQKTADLKGQKNFKILKITVDLAFFKRYYS